MKKIFLSAFACDPVTGSEPYVGWNWVKMLSRDYEVHVITRSENKAIIETVASLDNVKFHYFDFSFSRGKGHYWRFIKLYYVLWQLFIVFKVWRICKVENITSVHHVTYNNLDVPGFLWLIPNVSYIWGPVGGGQTPPKSLKTVYGRVWWKQKLRKRIKQFAMYNPVVRLALLKASHVFFANEDTKSMLGGFTKKSSVLLETAVDGVRKEILPSKKSDFIWVGRIEERKALILVIDAIKQLKLHGNEVRLRVVGDGPLMERMEQYCHQIGVAENVDFLGRIPHADVRSEVSSAKAFVFSSVQDTSGNVVLEAMAEAVPVIALKHQGVKEMVNEGGILVDVSDYATTVDRFANAMLLVNSDRAYREQLSVGALRDISSSHTWEAKMLQVKEVYESII